MDIEKLNGRIPSGVINMITSIKYNLDKKVTDCVVFIEIGANSLGELERLLSFYKGMLMNVMVQGSGKSSVARGHISLSDLEDILQSTE